MNLKRIFSKCILKMHLNTVILSFLKRERERTVNVFDYSSQSVTRSRLEGS